MNTPLPFNSQSARVILLLEKHLSNWKLIVQMPFGKPMEQPDEKQFQPLENRIKIFK